MEKIIQQPPALSFEKKQLLKKIAVGISLLVALPFFIFYFVQPVKQRGNTTPIKNDVTRVQSFKDAQRLSVRGNDSKPLQDFFAKDLKDGKNDDTTKSAIYWITHRYFDNGGDIYEIYNFIDSHPEVTFLKKAEAIYPATFTKIKTEKVGNYSMESLQALLAYYDVIDHYGYADMAVWGLAANKYSELALRTDSLQDVKSGKLSKYEASKFKAMMTNKAMHYIEKSDMHISAVTLKTRNLEEMLKPETNKEDLLVGLNQYASAVQNMKGLGFVLSHPFTPLEIYTFNKVFAEKQVTRLYFFTLYLYSTSLINAREATKYSVKDPLDRILAYVKADPSVITFPHSSVARAINSKTEGESSVYSYENAKKLAQLHPGFKAWLKENGWKDSDF